MRVMGGCGAAFRRPQAATVRVGALIIALLALSTTLLLSPLLRRPTGSPHQLGVSWWLLALMFGLAELFVMHVQVRREAQTVSLSEIPLLIGLFFASPVALFAGWLIGPAAVLWLHRRQRPLKLAFNLSQTLAQACAASAMFAWLGPADSGMTYQVCLAAYATVAVSGVVSALATTSVIGLCEGRLRLADLLRDPVTAAITSLAVGSAGLLAVYALEADPSAALPLTICGFLLLVAYRAYASLSERHLSLGQLHHFTESVTRTPDVDRVMLAVLAQAKEILRAEWAQLTILPLASDHDGDRVNVHVELDARGLLARRTSARDDPAGILIAGVARSGMPLLITRQSPDDRQQAFLIQHNVRDAIVAPLHADGQVVGAITVADRLGDVRRFDSGDLKLLETVANHTSVALKNSQLVDQLRHASLHDDLTGLPNRALLQQRMQNSLQRLGSPEVPSLTVLLLDLDNFKDVNDTMGHQCGDRLLVDVGHRLEIAAGPQATVARLGGDEYAVVLTGLAKPEQAAAAATNLLRSLDEPLVINGVQVKIGASVGIARAPENGVESAQLIRCADVAMYEAKRAADGRPRRYDRSLDTHSLERLTLLGELRAAVERDELVIHVQPKADVATGAVVGAEALVRWEHPTRGLINPDDFIDLAEANGLMPALTRRVLKLATQLAADWHRHGDAFTIAVNVSPRSLTNHDLAAQVAEALNSSGLPPEFLTLEITESTIMSDLNTAKVLLDELHSLGVQISIDDFGTGYSSLSYLKRLPVHEMKVDRSFVMDMATDVEDQVIVRTIVGLGQNLGLSVVAEGVEDRATWARLRRIGCTYVQGYYLSRPLPSKEFSIWLDGYRAKTALATAACSTTGATGLVAPRSQ